MSLTGQEARTQAAAYIRDERKRQQAPPRPGEIHTGENWTPEHDAHHQDGELLAAAYAYRYADPGLWPWTNPPKIRTARENLIRAGALALAEADACAKRVELNRPYVLIADFPTWGISDRPETRVRLASTALAVHEECADRLADLLRGVPTHDYDMPHDARLPGSEGCPPNCPARQEMPPSPESARRAVTRNLNGLTEQESTPDVPRFRDEPQPRRLPSVEKLVEAVSGEKRTAYVRCPAVSPSGAHCAFPEGHGLIPDPVDVQRLWEHSNRSTFWRDADRTIQQPSGPVKAAPISAPYSCDPDCTITDPHFHNLPVDTAGNVKIARDRNIDKPAEPAQPRIFYLDRDVDVTGVSGTGRVAEGVVFSDGVVSMRWTSKHPSSVVWYDGIEAVRQVHCHDSKTRITFADEAVSSWSLEDTLAVRRVIKLLSGMS